MAIYSNPQSGLSTMRRLKLLICLAILAAVPAIGAGAAWPAEMVMLVQPGCPWCAKFDAEIAPAWPSTPEGRRAPLRRVDITGPWPEDLAKVTPERFTPTFILIDQGREVARLRGYPGDQFFWYLVDDMLAKLPPGNG
jgi:hypothetical protein